jgi:hypothetical protein
VPVLQPSTHGVTDVRPPEFSRSERARVLVMTAAGSVVIGYAAVAALLALIAATATHAAFSTTGVLTAAAPGWLVAHHVPLRFEGAQLGVLPLLPTALLMLLAARAAAGAADRLGLYEPLQARAVVFCIAGAHAVTGGTIALLMGDGPVRATPAVAFFGCAAVSGVAATIGVAQRCGLVEVLIDRIDPVARRGMRAGLLALFVLGGTGALVVALGLAFSWSTTSSLFTGDSIGVGLGLWLLCLGYLPNAIIGALSYVVGAGFSIGDVAMTPMRFSGGPVPAVPLLAALPEQQLSFLPGLLLLPLLLGGLVGWYCRKISDRPSTRMRAVLVAGVTVAVTALVLAAVAGGTLGAGVFTPVTVPAGLLAVLVLGWIVVPGSFVAYFAGVRPKRVPAEAPDIEQISDEEAEEADEEYEDEDEDYEEAEDEYDDYEDTDEELELEDALAEEFEDDFDDELAEDAQYVAEEDVAEEDVEDIDEELLEDAVEELEEEAAEDDDTDDASPEPPLTGKAD